MICLLIEICSFAKLIRYRETFEGLADHIDLVGEMGNSLGKIDESLDSSALRNSEKCSLDGGAAIHPACVPFFHNFDVIIVELIFLST